MAEVRWRPDDPEDDTPAPEDDLRRRPVSEGYRDGTLEEEIAVIFAQRQGARERGLADRPELPDRPEQDDDRNQRFDERGVPTDMADRAGRWVDPPQKRAFHSEFNARYEDWCREITGAQAGKEYRVERDGEAVHFDTRAVGRDPGDLPEKLIDAKGRYEQFIDPRTREWKDFFQRFPDSGVAEMIETAKKQVRVANGTPVEWWCSGPNHARAMNKEFRDVRPLRGKITAVHLPMADPEDWTTKG